MTRYVWTLSDGIYRLRPEGGPPGSSVVSLWLEGDMWQRTVWDSDYTAEHGETVGTLEDAQREAVEHARRLGVIGEKDEVCG